MPAAHSFCSACGVAYATLTWPRTCANCGTTTWANPVPVAVVLIPVETEDGTGLLVIRRGDGASAGRLALVGGFVESHETWQEGGAREVWEEAGLRIDPATIVPGWYTSTSPNPNRILLFCEAPPVRLADLEAHVPDAETWERGIVFGPGGLDETFAFPLHAEAARRFFAARGISGPAAFRAA